MKQEARDQRAPMLGRYGSPEACQHHALPTQRLLGSKICEETKENWGGRCSTTDSGTGTFLRSRKARTR
jgi:hypothetical protein